MQELKSTDITFMWFTGGLFLLVFLTIILGGLTVLLKWSLGRDNKMTTSPFANFIGKKVWVVQFDDEDGSVNGVLSDVGQNFLAIRQCNHQPATLLVNLSNVKEIEICREDEEKSRHLSVIPLRKKGDRPKDDGDDQSS